MKFKTINPATEEEIQEFETMPKKQVMQILNEVNEAYLLWKDVPVSKKAVYFRKLCAILRKNKEQYARTITKEMGKPIKDSRSEVEKCAFCCDVYADNAIAWMQDDVKIVDGKDHRVILQPLGVILAIMPWNFPFWQAFRFAIPTLLVGNAGILKHASNVSECALAIEEAFMEAAFPKNVFRTVIADHESVAEVIASPFVHGVSLTGSTQAGKKIAEAAGKHLRHMVMELGGSDPFIVLKDADVELAAKMAVVGRFINNGQSCIAAKRFIVHESLVSEFSRLFAEKASALVVGDPTDEKTNLGPLVNKQALESIEKQVQDAIKKGATVLTGAKRLGEVGYYYAPTVIMDTTPDMEIVTNETFGPIAAIIVFNEEEDAIAIANDIPYGLGASIWTKDLERAK